MQNMIPTPEYIPHEKFHEGTWLFSAARPGWFYFWKKENNNSIRNPGFYESVDAPLKELVSFLHGKGIKTTPSCSGHCKSEKSLETLYGKLERDMQEIKNNGLLLKDIESGDIYVYRDEHYLLPWSKQKFLHEVMMRQGNGIIGIRADENIKGLLSEMHIPAVKIIEKDSIIFFLTTANETGIPDTWKRITEEIKYIFRNQ